MSHALDTKQSRTEAGRAPDPMPLHGIHHVELWVGNAAQSAHFYEHALGFRPIAYAGLETGVRDRVSHVLEQGRVRIVLTGALGADSPIAEHHRRHGDGIRDIALSVPDARHAWEHALARGAKGLVPPHELRDEHGVVRLATIAAYGDTVHTFVERARSSRRVPSRLRAGRRRRRRRAGHRRRACCSRSTTSSATSSSARWRRGSPSTSASSA